MLFTQKRLVTKKNLRNGVQTDSYHPIKMDGHQMMIIGFPFECLPRHEEEFALQKAYRATCRSVEDQW